MKDLRTFRLQVVEPALRFLHGLGGPAVDPKAVRLLLAIARQEGGPNLLRRQVGGPARGAWQFEKSGGVKGVMTHTRTAELARALTGVVGLHFTAGAIHTELEYDDTLACGFARLLLWTDPKPLPADERAAWMAYISLWRPGKPRFAHWSENWRLAGEAMGDPP